MHRVAVPAQHISRQFKNIYRPHWSGGLSPACPPLNFTFPQLYIHYPAPWWSIETQSGLWLLKTDHVTWSRLDQSDHGDQQQGRNSESCVKVRLSSVIKCNHRDLSSISQCCNHFTRGQILVCWDSISWVSKVCLTRECRDKLQHICQKCSFSSFLTL